MKTNRKEENEMKRALSILSLIMAFCILLSCTVTGASAAEEPQTPFYVRYQYEMRAAGLPKTIQAQFDYDQNFCEVASDYYTENYPSYVGTGFIFPPVTEEYGNLYDVSYTVNDTIISYTYTLKSGKTLDDYIDAINAIREKNGVAPVVSREEVTNTFFPVFDIVMKITDNSYAAYLAKVTDHKIIQVIDTDGKELRENGRQDGEIYVHCYNIGLPDPDAPATPDEAQKDYKYREKLFSQYHLNEYALEEYDEIYEHTDENGEVDWAIVKAATNKQTSSLYTSPRYFEFGNRVLDIEDELEPFYFGMGVYSVKHDRFFDVYAPELYELDELERVWTQIGAGRLIGDMDGDNTLTTIDAVMIQRCAAGMQEYPESDKNIPSDMVQNPLTYFSDFDQDGERTIMDVTAIQRYLANMTYRSSNWTPYPHKEQPTNPAPTEPQPTEPAPTEPQPTEPVPTEAETQAPTEAVEPSPQLLATPQITDFKSTSEGVEIHIGTVDGAEKYRVYYRNKNGNWVNMGETTNGVFVDTDVKTGSSYRYTVRCIKADLSEFTSEFNSEGWSYTYYPTPKITKCEAVSGGVEITWNPVKGAEKYRVYYKGSKGWTRMADVSGTSYIDTDVSGGHTYTYTVRCVSSDGTQFMSDYDSAGTSFYLFKNPEIEGFTTRMDGIEIQLTASRGLVRLYRKTSGGSWIRIDEFDSQEYDCYLDTDVEPGKTYTYTARIVNEKGDFLSWYNTSGWSYTYKKADCQPELEYFVYNGENTAFVQLKIDNKFGLKQFNIHVIIDGDYRGTFQVPDAPALLQADFFQPNNEYLLYIAGIDSNGNEITAEGEQWVSTITRPTNLKAEKTDSRSYSLTWSGSYPNSYLYEVNIISQDGEYAIDSDIITEKEYTFDLSEYPEDTEWMIYVYVINDDGVSLSCDSIEFKES